MKNLLKAGALALALLSCAPHLAMAQTDAFSTYADNVSAPCRHWTTITPSDSTNLTSVPKAIYVGGAGDLALIGVDAPGAATGVTWKNVPASAILPVRPRRVLATGTTATFLIACF